MPAPTKLQTKIAEQKQAIDRFAHLHRELAAMRESLSLPEEVRILDSLLTLNAESLRLLKDDLAASLERQKHLHPVDEPESFVAGQQSVGLGN